MKPKNEPVQLTEKFVARAKAPTGDGITARYWDKTLKGFCLQCSGKKPEKKFIVLRDIRRNGKRVTTRNVNLGTTAFMDVKTARQKAEQILGGIAAGIDPKERALEEQTFGQWLTTYLDKRPLRERSKLDYKSLANTHLKDWMDVPIGTITPDMVETRYRSIEKTIASRKGGRGTDGKATANRAMRAFRTVYNFAMDRSPSLPRNPVTARLKGVWNIPVVRTRVIANNQFPAFYQAVNELTNEVARDFILFLLFTGCRRNEAASLQWAYVDFSAKVINVPARLTKADRQLPLPMTDFVFDLIMRRRKAGNRKGWIFHSTTSKSGHLQEPKSFMKQVVEKAEIATPLSVHDLRRTWATIADQCDLPDRHISALVNHALPRDSVTHNYLVMTADRLREPAQKVTDKLKSLCGIKEISDPKVAKIS